MLDFFLHMRYVCLFDHLIVINDNWGRFAKVHAFRFDDLEFTPVMPGLGQFFDLFAQFLAAFPLAVGAIADEDEFSVVTHIRLEVGSSVPRTKYKVRSNVDLRTAFPRIRSLIAFPPLPHF